MVVIQTEGLQRGEPCVYGAILVSKGVEWTQSTLGICGQERAKDCRKDCEATPEIWSICK